MMATESLNARLVKREHVGVTLDHHDPTALRRGSVRQVDAEELAALVEDVVLRRVEVLRPSPLAHRTRAEAEHLPTPVGEREHDAPAKAVVDAALSSVALRETGVHELLRPEAALLGAHDHPVPRARRVADPELAKDLLRQAATGQVLPCALVPRFESKR